MYKRQALKALEDPNGEWGDKIMELMDTVDSYIPDPERDTCLLYTSYVSCSEVELWTIVVEEWSMTSTFILC